MNRNQRTLVALSGTETDHSLIAYARTLAALGFARQYHFVHVRTAGEADARSDDQVRAAIDEAIAAGFTPTPPEVTFTSHVLTGIRIDGLIESAAHFECDLILLGHRASRSGQRSLARRLAMIAPCSVWMLPEMAATTFKNILAPIDFSENSADSLEVAASIARAAGASQCTAIHVYSDPAVIRYDEHAERILTGERQRYEQFLAPLNIQGVHVEPIFVEGNNVAQTVLHHAKKMGADLLVVNTRGRSRAASILLGSVTSEIMTDSPITVLAVKHFNAMLNLFQALRQSHIWTQRGPHTN